MLELREKLIDEKGKKEKIQTGKEEKKKTSLTELRHQMRSGDLLALKVLKRK